MADGSGSEQFVCARYPPLSLPAERPQAALLSGGGHQPSRYRCLAGQTPVAPSAHPVDPGDGDGQDESGLSTDLEIKAVAGRAQYSLLNRPRLLAQSGYG